MGLRGSLLPSGLLDGLLVELPSHTRGGDLARYGRLGDLLQEAQFCARA